MSGPHQTGIALEELFAGYEMRATDEPVEAKFAVMAKALTTFGVEVELCRFQYRPHALAVAALPEIVEALMGALSALQAYRDKEVATAYKHDIALALAARAFEKAEYYGD